MYEAIRAKKTSRRVTRPNTGGAGRTLARAAVLGLVVALGAGCAGTEERENAAEFADDSVITGKVKTALARDDAGTLLNVEVETFQGIVQLSGFVDTESEKLRAGEIAEGVEDVRRVENSLIIKPAS